VGRVNFTVIATWGNEAFGRIPREPTRSGGAGSSSNEARGRASQFGAKQPALFPHSRVSPAMYCDAKTFATGEANPSFVSILQRVVDVKAGYGSAGVAGAAERELLHNVFLSGEMC